MKATGKVFDVAELEPETVTDMFTLMERYFADVNRDVFEADLFEKNEVVLIHAGDALAGFSTMQLHEETLNGEQVLVLFSGDTVMDREHWGSPELQRCFAVRAARTMQENDLPLYWLLICGGYRTYRYLPIFFREFWPRHDAATPSESQQMIDTLATRRFNGKYRDGVVIDSNGYLREDVSPIDERHLRNPHVAFFERANPGHLRGHELVCLTQFTPDNLTRALHKLMQGNHN